MDFTKGRRTNDANSPLSEKKSKPADAKALSANKALVSETKHHAGHNTNRSQDEGKVASGDQAQISVGPRQPKYER